MSGTRTYRSRVDWWLGLLLVAVPVISVGTAVLLTLSGDAGEAVIGWLVVLGLIGMYVGVVWPLRYELTDGELVVRFGLMRTRVPYARIRGVVPSRSVLAAPALSLDRLALDIGQALPLTISPDDRDGFLDDLAARVPGVVRDGSELVQAEPSS